LIQLIVMKTVKSELLVIGAGAAGSMAAIKASDYTEDIIVLEKAAHRSGGALGIGHYTSEVNPICNVPGGPTSMEFVEGYMSSSSGWSGIERPLDKYIISTSTRRRMEPGITTGISISVSGWRAVAGSRGGL